MPLALVYTFRLVRIQIIPRPLWAGEIVSSLLLLTVLSEHFVASINHMLCQCSARDLRKIIIPRIFSLFFDILFQIFQLHLLIKLWMLSHKLSSTLGPCFFCSRSVFNQGNQWIHWTCYLFFHSEITVLHHWLSTYLACALFFQILSQIFCLTFSCLVRSEETNSVMPPS